MMVPRSSAMTEASGPNEPPVMISGPLIFAVKMDSPASSPDTAKPKTFPWVKFHAQWMPIGNHREFEYLYAAPSRIPASITIARELHMLAPGLNIWANPKIRAEIPNAHHNPNLSSISLKMTPRNMTSSQQATRKKRQRFEIISDQCGETYCIL